jgi:hypothetical protein
MLGDNMSVVVSSTIPTSTLKKRHNAIAYHHVREAVAAGILIFLHIEGKLNPADILTKHLSSVVRIPLMKPILNCYDPYQSEGSVNQEAMGGHGGPDKAVKLDNELRGENSVSPTQKRIEGQTGQKDGDMHVPVMHSLSEPQKAMEGINEGGSWASYLFIHTKD